VFLDLVTTLGANGIGPTQIPAKIEGLAIGQDVMIGGSSYHTLWVANDNDFDPVAAGPNRFYVFSFQDGDLPLTGDYVAQHVAAVPEPSTWALSILGLGGLGAMMRRRKRTDAAVPQACN
jgi:hypothetical protein